MSIKIDFLDIYSTRVDTINMNFLYVKKQDSVHMSWQADQTYNALCLCIATAQLLLQV